MKTWAVNDWNFHKNVELIYAFDMVSTDVINSGYWIHFMIKFKNIGDKIKYKDHPRSIYWKRMFSIERIQLFKKVWYDIIRIHSFSSVVNKFHCQCLHLKYKDQQMRDPLITIQCGFFFFSLVTRRNYCSTMWLTLKINIKNSL